MYDRIRQDVFSAIVLGLVFAPFRANCQVNPPDNIDLGKIVITASKLQQVYKNSTQNIGIINSADIQASGVNEIAGILNLLPSVDVLEYGSPGATRSAQIRGASSTQVLTLIDGRPINTPRDGFTDFNQISLSNIKRIEVLRGPASSIYGSSAVGGVINIITKSGQDAGPTVLLTKDGSFATHLASLSHGSKIRDFDYFLSYDYLTSHGNRDNSDYLSHNINTKLGYQIDSDNRISLASGYYTSEVGDIGQVSFQDLDDRHKTSKKYLDLTYTGKAAGGQDILMKFYHNVDRLEFIEQYNPTDKDTHQTQLYGFESQVSQVFLDTFRTALGVDYKEYKLNSSASAKHYYNVKGIYVESETDFLQNETYWLHNGVVKAGARWDDYSNFGDRISPSASFSLWLRDVFKLHGLVAQSFRAPTFNDLYWPKEDWGIFGGVEGNTHLGPEKATSYEAGVSTYPFNKFKTDITFFKTKFEDLIEWTVDSLWWWRPTNINSATVKGVEYESEFVLTEKLKADVNYTYLEAKDADTDKWLIYRPRHLYKLRLLYSPTERLELGLSGVYKAKRFINAENTAYLGKDYIVDFNTSYKCSENVTFLFDVTNIFNRHYQEQWDYPMPGRAFYGGIRILF